MRKLEKSINNVKSKKWDIIIRANGTLSKETIQKITQKIEEINIVEEIFGMGSMRMFRLKK